jgi:fatty acid desaturase
MAAQVVKMLPSRSKNRPKWLKECIRAGQRFHISKQSAAKHNLINLGSAALVWTALASLFPLSLVLPWFVYLPLAGVLFGCGFFAHFVLVVHECSHGMFLKTAIPGMNHKIGRLASLPFFTEYDKHWKQGHRIHHLRPCEEDDPQDRDPPSGEKLMEAYRQLWSSPFGALAQNPSRQYDGQLKRTVRGLAFWLPALAVGACLKWTVPLAMVLGFNVLASLRLAKIAQEHGGGLALEPDPALRSRTYSYPLQFLFSPFNINHHFEHHAHLCVPWYMLPRYGKAIKELMPQNLQAYYFHRDYWDQMHGRKKLPKREELLSQAS